MKHQIYYFTVINMYIQWWQVIKNKYEMSSDQDKYNCYRYLEEEEIF